jgi:DNA-binding MarR family transcriptional regulator
MKYQREGGFIISKIHQLGGRILARKLKEHNIEDLNPAQGRIMFVLWHRDGIPINELAKKTSLGKSTLTGMLDRLEESGFLVRTPSTEDRRKIIIKRTQKDRVFQRKYIRISQEMTEGFYKGFKKKEIDEFENFLRRIFNNLVAFD